MQSTNGHEGRAGATTKARAEARRIAVQTRHSLERAESEVRRQLTGPTTGAAIAGAAVVGAAMIVGFPEAILGAVAGLVVHHILRSRQAREDAPAPER